MWTVPGAHAPPAGLGAANTGRQIKLFSGHTAEVYFVAYAHDGKHIVTCGEDGTARLWDVATGQTLQTFNPNAGPVLAVAFSPDGRFVLTGGVDGKARL